ncbi:hypothetical protein QBC39DRAFT_369815 [Podospora conica]|nr:hypothetical protein QBC39DRAFT_369815 [Schizothecium conicum]
MPSSATPRPEMSSQPSHSHPIRPLGLDGFSSPPVLFSGGTPTQHAPLPVRSGAPVSAVDKPIADVFQDWNPFLPRSMPYGRNTLDQSVSTSTAFPNPLQASNARTSTFEFTAGSAFPALPVVGPGRADRALAGPGRADQTLVDQTPADQTRAIRQKLINVLREEVAKVNHETDLLQARMADFEMAIQLAIQYTDSEGTRSQLQREADSLRETYHEELKYLEYLKATLSEDVARMGRKSYEDMLKFLGGHVEGPQRGIQPTGASERQGAIQEQREKTDGKSKDSGDDWLSDGEEKLWREARRKNKR